MNHLLSKVKTLQKISDPAVLHDTLTELHQDLPSSLVKGRNVVAGTARAWGLQFGELQTALTNDPVYQESFNLVKGDTLLPELLLKNLFLILKYGIKNREGDMIEFGSYRCGTAIFLSKVAQELGYTGTVYALDTFEGIPKANEIIDFHMQGDFRELSFNRLVEHMRELGLKNLVLVKGSFEETLPKLLPNMKKVVLTHIDCDVDDSTRYAILGIEKQMDAQGYMIVDDVVNASCLGVMEAVEETLQKRGFHAEQSYPHFVYRIPKIF